MKNIKDIAIIVQARVNSQRVHNKMLRPFADTNLFELILSKLLKSKIIPKQNIIASVYENELKQIANNLNINIYNRSYESANNDNSLQKIYEWHDKIPFKYVIKVNGCSPLLKIETIDSFTQQFIKQKEENLFGVIETKDYYWNKNGKLITPWPKNQTIMNTKAVETTYKAAHVLYSSKIDLIKDNKFMGNFQKEQGIKLYPINELECFDIDYEWQFKMGEKLFER